MKSRSLRKKMCLVTAGLALICLWPIFDLTNTEILAADVVRLKSQSWGGATYQPRIMVEKTIAKLRASGKFKVDYFPGEPLMGAKEAFDGMREGVLQMAISAAGYHEDRMKLVGTVQWMPLNFDFDKFAVNYRKPGGFMDFAQPYYQKVGLRLLSDLHQPVAILCTTKPVHKLEDMNGKLVRDAGGMAEWIKLLGAAPMGMASADIYEGFQRGVVEGNVGSLSSYMSSKWYEVAPYIARINWFCSGMQLMMNLEFYNKLTAEQKEILERAILESEAEFFDVSRKSEEELFKTAEKQGAKVYSPPPEEMVRWEAAIKPMYDKYAKMYGEEWNRFMKLRQTLK